MMVMNSRMVVLVCAMLLVSPLFVVSTPAAGTDGSSGGSGRIVIMIHNVTELQNISSNLAAGYWLANDIDASETVNWNGGAGFMPMGSWSPSFQGTFDGKGFKITGLFINRPGMNDVGIFSFNGGTIERLDLECNITGRTYAGGVCGYNNGGTLANCTVRGSVRANISVAGGICGGTGTMGFIRDCVNYANVSATTNTAGGIVGSNQAVIQSCTNLGNVSSVTGMAGGLVGAMNSGSVSYSFAAANVSASTTNGNRVGGFIGYLMGGTIDSCSAASNTTGYLFVGGFAGAIDSMVSIVRSFCGGSIYGFGDIGGFVGYNQATISDSYSITTVMGPNAGTGFFGSMDMGLISRCYAAGPVLPPLSWSGGFSGGGMGSSNVANSFWDTNATGRMTTTGGGTGKTTTQMMTGSTFTGATWDFTNTWGIIEGKTYPYLRWRYPSAVLVSGTAYSDGGVTPAVCGTVIRVIDGSGLSVGMGDAKANATGCFSQIVQPGPVVAYLSGMAYKGAALKPDVNGNDGKLDVQGGKVMATCGPSTIVHLTELAKAKKRCSTNELPFNATADGLVMTDGVSFATPAGVSAVLSGNLTAPDKDIAFGGPVQMPENSTLAAANVMLDSTVSAAKALVLNCTADVKFGGAVQAGSISIVSARHVTALSTVSATTFDQQSGTGTTGFGAVGLSATTATVKTAGVTGRVNAGSLSIGTGTADLTGLVGGKGGQQGADAVVLLNKILPGSNFFDGIDLYKFTPTSLPDATEDAPYLVNFTPMNPGDAVTWSIDTGLAWLNMSANGSLTGMPGNGDVGKGYVNVITHNGPKSLAYNLTISVLNVNDAPQILTQDVLTATQDALYSVYYSGSDIDPTADVLVWSVTTGPAWLRMDQNNLHGTPANRDVGVHAVTVTVSDGKGGITSTSFNITVANVNDGPTITSVPMTTATQGQLYNFTFAASDIDANDTLTWTLTANATWPTMNATTGTLSGMPGNRDVGDLLVTVTVKDAAGASANLSFVLHVINVNDAPVWAAVPADQNLTEGQQLVAFAQATDIDVRVGDSVRYSLTSTPASGITIDPLSGSIFWQSAVAGAYVVTVTATDGIVPITTVFNVTVSARPLPPVNNAPTIDTLAAQTTTVGKTLTVKMTGKDSDSWDARNLTFSLVGPLSGMVISADGSFVWTPAKDQSGVHTITVQLSDGKNSTTATFTVTVKKAATGGSGSASGDTTMMLGMGLILGLVVGLVVGMVVMKSMGRKPPQATAPGTEPAPSAGPADYRPSAPEKMAAPASTPAPAPKAPTADDDDLDDDLDDDIDDDIDDDNDDDIDEDFPDADKPEPVPTMRKAGEGQAPPPAPPAGAAAPPSVPPPE
jgi:hypothetical protein